MMILLLLAIGCPSSEAPDCVVFQDTCDCGAAAACLPREEADAAESCDIDCGSDSGDPDPGTCAPKDGGCAFE